jgi:hypothetical protein
LQTLRRFLSPSTGIIAACPLGLPWCSSMDCIISGSGSVSVALLQVVVSSNSDRTDCIVARISRWMVSLNSDPNIQIMDIISAWLASILASILMYRMTFVSACTFST